MRNLFCFLLGAQLLTQVANASCVAESTVYTSCKPGYYLSGTNCLACPDGATSVDHNTGGITSCCLPAGTAGSDSTGVYTYASQCCYSN